MLATEGTVRGGAYQRAILALRPDAHVTQVACQIFVALAEEGWSEGEAVDAVTERYLAHLDARVDTVVLGCTHFPLLAGAITRQLGSDAPRRGFRRDHGASHGAELLADAELAAQRARAGACAPAGHRQPGTFRAGRRAISRAHRSRKDGGGNRSLDTFHNAVTLGAPRRG